MRNVLYIVLFLSLGVHAQKTTVKAGNWSDPAVWGGMLPVNEDVRINHDIILNVDASVRNVTIHNARLIFDVSRSINLQITDLRATGKSQLAMKPASQTIDHAIEVVGVKESLFVGGGMKPLDTDPGIWIMDEAQLDLQGNSKLSWTTLAQGLPVGSPGTELEFAL